MISKKTIIISIIVAALLVCAYFLIGIFDNDSLPETSEDKVNLSTQSESPSSENAIFETEKDKISSISISNSQESYEFYYNGNEWKAKGNEDVLYNQASVLSLSLDYVSVVPSLVVEEDSTNPEKYGFDAPKATSTVKTTDGKSAKFILGDKTKGGNGYYLMMDGDKNVYTISSVVAGNMLKSLVDFRDKSIVTISEGDITAVKMKVVGVGDVIINRLEEQLDMITSWKMSAPYEMGVYDDRFSELVLTPMLAVQAIEFIEDNPTPEQLTDSGFDSPELYYEISTANENIRVEIGKNYDGSYVVRRTDKPTVYLVNSEALSFLYGDVFDYIHSYAYLPDHNSVKKIVCQTKNGEYTLTENNDEYTINGNKIIQKKYSEYYQKLFDVKIQGNITTPATNPDDVVLTYTVHNSDGSVDKISFINENSKYSYMSVNDKMDFYVFNEAVNNASGAIEELFEYSKNPVSDEADSDTTEEKISFNWLGFIIAVLIVLLVAAFPISLLRSSKNKK